MPIRVLHVISGLNLGGAQVTLKYLIENIDAGQFTSFIYPLRQKHIAISISGNIIKMPYCNYDPRKFLAILRLSRKYRIDIIHAHLEKPIILSLLASFFCRASIVIHEHGSIFFKGLKYSVYRFLLRLLHFRAVMVISVSRAATTQLVEKVGIRPERIRVIYNAVDFSKFNPQRPNRNSVRKLLKVAPNDIVIGFVGRLDYVKGVNILIEATALLLRKCPCYLLVVVGEGPCYSTLLRLTQQFGIATHVIFLGFRDNVAEVMDAFDIAVIPSRQEAFPLVPLEIMRKKIPIICSGVGGMAEIAENEVTALVPAENNPRQISGCIERLAADQTLQKKLTENAYRSCEQFSVPNFVNAIRQIYFELAKC